MNKRFYSQKAKNDWKESRNVQIIDKLTTAPLVRVITTIIISIAISSQRNTFAGVAKPFVARTVSTRRKVHASGCCCESWSRGSERRAIILEMTRHVVGAG